MAKKCRKKLSPMEILIEEKKQIFEDFNADWDEKIEQEFFAQLKTKPNRDPQAILDQICRPYIMRRLSA